ncbi:anti-sigma factor domain-containing protein [Clostridium manihotivorum]|uniref:RsgI N-terminal anti-sigma domain-containing protein n=1 Tax=Clostridium manihotivorum TaxID=2320868 RepID=A0A3R5U7D4_9CLOT|nr:anti-sigma factor domain-containing protein [Clostridium manihotivorum]QAA30707.1 hypothetical protein C1I91_02940 [Clostridium manihotivorum]
MNKKGLVVDIKGNKVVILTDSGEFTLVKASKVLPIKGETYEGNVVGNGSSMKRIAVLAASFLLIFTIGIVDYYNPVKAVELSAKSKILLEANRWNRIVRVSTDDKKIKDVINVDEVKNMSLNDGLIMLSNEVKDKNIVASYSELSVKPIKGNPDMNTVTSEISSLSKAEKNNDIENKEHRDSSNKQDTENSSDNSKKENNNSEQDRNNDKDKKNNNINKKENTNGDINNSYNNNAKHDTNIDNKNKGNVEEKQKGNKPINESEKSSTKEKHNK